MDPTPHIVESALLLLAAFLLGCLIGFALRKLVGRKPEPQNDEAGGSATPDGNDAPGSPDDLQKIKGIGPKLEALLHGNGIKTYAQIAAWDAQTVADMNERLSFSGRIEREEWVSQARHLLETQES